MKKNETSAENVIHSSSSGSVESITSRAPRGNDTTLETTTGNPTGRSGLTQPTGEDAFWSKTSATDGDIAPGLEEKAGAPSKNARKANAAAKKVSPSVARV